MVVQAEKSEDVQSYFSLSSERLILNSIPYTACGDADLSSEETGHK